MEDLNGIYRRLVMGERILDDELTQIKELLIEIARKGTKSFTLWIRGVESAEMAQRERILNRLSGAGLVDLEWKYTDHNAYIRTRITEKGAELIKLISAIPKCQIK